MICTHKEKAKAVEAKDYANQPGQAQLSTVEFPTIPNTYPQMNVVQKKKFLPELDFQTHEN